MTKDYVRKDPLKPIRDRIACNLIKATQLGNAHDPYAPQSNEMVKALADTARPGRGSDVPLDARTWESWWQGMRKIQPSNIHWLDRLSGQAPGFISALLTGQEFDHPLHWHLLALDAACCWESRSPEWVAERERKAMNATRALHRRWAPNRRRLPHVFDGHSWGDYLSDRACDVYDQLAPTSTISFLFELARETNYLNDSRLETWAFDLATAISAACGLFRHLNSDAKMRTKDFSAITELMTDVFWDASPLSMTFDTNAHFYNHEWDIASRFNLDKAGWHYRRFIERMGIDVSDLCTIRRPPAFSSGSD